MHASDNVDISETILKNALDGVVDENTDDDKDCEKEITLIRTKPTIV